jgi:hypothetical protein
MRDTPLFSIPQIVFFNKNFPDKLMFLTSRQGVPFLSDSKGGGGIGVVCM